MYAGTTLKQFRNLDSWFGAHQNIDRLARKQLAILLKPKFDANFPTAKEILKFEGIDGPDGIKRKTPAQDEPWHFFDPRDKKDTKLVRIIRTHHTNLVNALTAGKTTKASFEAAWLAHAVVDGLTPAHHYPYEQELMRLRGGADIESRTTPLKKVLMPGSTLWQKLRNNWAMWGDKGLLATHLAFEFGVAVLAVPLSSASFSISATKAKRIARGDAVETFFMAQANKVADLGLYEQFYRTGWTPKLARNIRKQLMPILIETVAVLWYSAAETVRGKSV